MLSFLEFPIHSLHTVSVFRYLPVGGILMVNSEQLKDADAADLLQCCVLASVDHEVRLLFSEHAVAVSLDETTDLEGLAVVETAIKDTDSSRKMHRCIDA